MLQPAEFSRREMVKSLGALRREFMVVGLFSMATNFLLLTPTIYMLLVFDKVMVSRSHLTLLWVTLIGLFLFALMAFIEWARSRLLVRIGVRLDTALGPRVFNAAFAANLNPNSESPDRAFADLTEIRQFLTGHGIFALFDVPWTPIYVAVLFVMHPLLGWLSILFAAVQIGLAWTGHRLTTPLLAQASRAQTDTTAFLHSKLRSVEVVEPMGMLDGLTQRWCAKQEALTSQQSAAHAVVSRMAAWSKWVRYCQQSLALGAGALLVIRGQLSPGGMIAASVLISRALAPIDMAVATWRSWINARAAFDRLDQLLTLFPDRACGTLTEQPSGAVALRHLVVAAPACEPPILKDINLVADPGSVTVILGPSGSGKTTLARSILGVWPSTEGEVLLDDRPLHEWNRWNLGLHLGYLPQDIELFDGTIAENIARFSETKSAQVIAAAQSVGLHDMILRFPRGYDTPIGEAGNLLSGGQRQRIGLARAIYGDPTIVVLDEPNANLDDSGEIALMGAVRELKAKGKTVFLITHRSGVVALADQLWVMRNGSVFLQGPREQVLAKLAAPPAATPSTVPSSRDGVVADPV